MIALVIAAMLAALPGPAKKVPAPVKTDAIGLLPGEVPTHVSSDPRPVPVKK